MGRGYPHPVSFLLTSTQELLDSSINIVGNLAEFLDQFFCIFVQSKLSSYEYPAWEQRFHARGGVTYAFCRANYRCKR
jgi:hypothetical protein